MIQIGGGINNGLMHRLLIRLMVHILSIVWICCQFTNASQTGDLISVIQCLTNSSSALPNEMAFVPFQYKTKITMTSWQKTKNIQANV